MDTEKKKKKHIEKYHQKANIVPFSNKCKQQQNNEFKVSILLLQLSFDGMGLGSFLLLFRVYIFSPMSPHQNAAHFYLCVSYIRIIMYTIPCVCFILYFGSVTGDGDVNFNVPLCLPESARFNDIIRASN